MFIVKKEVTFAAAHNLCLDYESKCTNLHGHEWKVYISLSAKELDKNGMVIDFAKVKSFINKNLDHKYLNEVLPFNPTAENIAKYISDSLTDERVTCFEVELYESHNNCVIYRRD